MTSVDRRLRLRGGTLLRVCWRGNLRRGRGRAERQEHMEGAARAGQLGGCPETAAMLFGNALADGQAEAQACIVLVHHVRAAVEAIGNMRKVFRWNANTLIGHSDMRHIPFLRHGYPDLAPIRAVLDGVLQQIVKQLKDAGMI